MKNVMKNMAHVQRMAWMCLLFITNRQRIPYAQEESTRVQLTRLAANWPVERWDAAHMKRWDFVDFWRMDIHRFLVAGMHCSIPERLCHAPDCSDFPSSHHCYNSPGNLQTIYGTLYTLSPLNYLPQFLCDSLHFHLCPMSGAALLFCEDS